jgi:hypothetical protein
MRQKLLRKKKSCFFQAVICSARAVARAVAKFHPNIKASQAMNVNS